jgi:hypothetical protein
MNEENGADRYRLSVGFLERSPRSIRPRKKDAHTINAKTKSFRRVCDLVSGLLEDKVVEPILVSRDRASEDNVATEYSHIGRELVTCS